MKKALLTLVFIIAFQAGYTQTVAENYTDEFTKNKVVKSDWEKISNNTDLYLNVRINKINENNFIELKVVTNSVTSIYKDHDISFMFDNGDIVTLHSTKSLVSDYGDGAVGLAGSEALGLDIDCVLSDSDIQKFKANAVKKIRINKSEGYSESDIKPKNAEKLKQLFLLMFK